MWWARLLNVISGLFSGGVAASTNSYESIATTTVGSGGTSTITFSSIPSTYKNLQIRLFAQTNRSSASGDYITLRFNSDSGTNYNGHFLGGNGTTAVAGVQGNANVMYVERISCSTQTNIFGAIVMDILDYGSTNKNKVARWLGGYDVNGDAATTNMQLASGLWLNSANAITSITLNTGVGTAFTQYSSFALYGIKG
jgi:hypothetical protein